MEEWKDIPGYEGLYEASNLGRIRTAQGKTTTSARFDKRVWKQRVMKPKHPNTGKREDGRLSLWKDGEVKDYLVARLIAMAWLGLPPEGYTVNHKNGIWSDNRPENLEWISLSENIKHGFETGLYDSIMKPVVLIEENGERMYFKSLSSADRYLGRKVGYLSNAIIKGLGVHGTDGRNYRVLQERG